MTTLAKTARIAQIACFTALAPMVLTAGCTIEPRSDEFRCDTSMECDADRLCEEGFCVSGIGHPVCTEIRNRTCVILCDEDGSCPEQVVCPPGVACRVTCGGLSACQQGVDCGAAESCIISCSGQVSCAGAVTCGDGRCDIDCTGASSCAGALDCARSCRCDTECSGASQCGSVVSCPGGGQCQQSGECRSNPGGCSSC